MGTCLARCTHMHRALLYPLLLLTSLVAPLAGQTARWGDELPRQGTSIDHLLPGSGRAVEDPKSSRKMGLRGRAYLEAHFSRDKIGEKLVEVLEEL